VAEGRRIPVEKVREIADGRIFTGRQAKEIGLVDQIGNIEDAVELAKSLAGIKGEPRIVKRKKKPGIFDLLTQKVSLNLPQSSPSISFKYIFTP
jgi:protease-4